MRSTTSACSSATARVRSTRGWRSTPSPSSPWTGSSSRADPDPAHAVAVATKNYVKAAGKGVLKVMSKMGISTVASYSGAQVFEAVGLGPDLVEDCFTGTTSRLGGIGLDELADEVARRHRVAHPRNPLHLAHRGLPGGGEYQWRREGEYHLFNPETVFKLQHATRAGRYDVFREYTSTGRRPVPPPGHAAGAVPLPPRGARAGAARGGRAGLRHRPALRHRGDVLRVDLQGGPRDPGHRHEPPRRQVEHRRGRRGRRPLRARRQRRPAPLGASSRWPAAASASPASTWSTPTTCRSRWRRGPSRGRAASCPAARSTRGSPAPGTPPRASGSISPPPHHDIYSIEDLAQLIHDLKNANPEARVHVKLVAEVGVGTVAAGVSKAHADVVLISGHDGGTGAAPLTSAQARGRAVGAGPGRDPADAAAQQAARPHRRAGRRPAEDRPGRGHRRPARRRGVRLRHRAPGRERLHHDAGLPPRHLPGRGRHPEPGAAGPLQRPARVRRELLRVHRRGGARAAGLARVPHARGGHRPGRRARRDRGRRPLEGGRPRPQPRSSTCRRWRPTRPVTRSAPRTTASTGRSTRPSSSWPVPPWSAADPVVIRLPVTNTNRTVGHDARLAGDPPLRRRGPARRHDHDPPDRLRRQQPRRLPASGDHAAHRGRRQRLRRQGPVRRAADHPARPQRHLPRRGEHHRRQRRPLRRHRRRDVPAGHGGRALLRAELRRDGRGGGRRRPRLRVHDRRPGGRAGPHRAELRRRHVGRHRLRARPGRRRSPPWSTSRWSTSTRSPTRTGRSWPTG